MDNNKKKRTEMRSIIKTAVGIATVMVSAMTSTDMNAQTQREMGRTNARHSTEVHQAKDAHGAAGRRTGDVPHRVVVAEHPTRRAVSIVEVEPPRNEKVVVVEKQAPAPRPVVRPHAHIDINLGPVNIHLD